MSTTPRASQLRRQRDAYLERIAQLEAECPQFGSPQSDYKSGEGR